MLLLVCVPELIHPSLWQQDQRQHLMEKLKKAQKEDEKLTKQLEKFCDCDPEVFGQMAEGLQVSKDSANRWIENIWILEGWMKKKFVGHEQDIKQLFKQKGVTDDLDTIA